MKTRIFLAGMAWLGMAMAARALDPVNGNASANAREVYAYIQQLKAAGFVISGQQVDNPWLVNDLSSKSSGESEITRVSEITGGKRPALVGLSWDFCATYADRRAAVIQLAKDQWAAGGLVTFSWHEASPLQASPDAAYEDPNSAWNGSLDSAQWNDLLHNNASTIHLNWQNHIDLVAGWLKQLRDAGVVVLWRPYHEVDGGWFWWNSGGAFAESNYKALWQMAYDRLVNYHGLNNLLWVYAPVQAYSSYCPSGSLDFGGHDLYLPDPDDTRYGERYLQISTMPALGGRPVALTECGKFPSADVLANDAQYAWVMAWFGGYLDKTYYGNLGVTAGDENSVNSPAEVRAFYANPRVVDLSNFRTALNPPVVVTSKKKVRTAKAKYALKGTASGMNLAKVRVKVRGKKKLVTARGTARWKAKIRLTRPRTKVTVTAVDALGRVSAPVKITLIRKAASSASGK